MYFQVIKQDTASEHLDIKKQLPEFILPPRRVRYWQLGTREVGIAISCVHFAAKDTFPLQKQRVSRNWL
jgi:hypothetical protein